MINQADINQPAQVDYEDQLDNIENKYGKGACGINDIENIAQDMLFTIPKLDRNQLREEMMLMHALVNSMMN